MAETAQHRPAWKALLALGGVLAAALTLQGCLFSRKKKPRPFTPPPVAARVPPQPRPVELEPLPEAAFEVYAGLEAPVIRVAGLPPAPPRPAPAKPAARPAPAPAVVETPPAVAPPRAAAIYSPEEIRQMNQELDGYLDRVRRALARAEGRALPPELAALANNARSFLVQAEQARSQDLVTAVTLAKRADLFAMDLVQRLP
jgi:hypothetical protein